MLKRLIYWGLDVGYPLCKKVLPYEVYAYLAVGAANTAFNILLFAGLYAFVFPPEGVQGWGIQMAPYTASLLLAFLITVPTGFWLAKHFAFQREAPQAGQTGKQLGKYFLVVLQGLGSDYLLLLALITYAGLHPTAAKIGSTVIVLTVNFLLQKYFTFAARSGEARTAS